MSGQGPDGGKGTGDRPNQEAQGAAEEAAEEAGQARDQAERARDQAEDARNDVADARDEVAEAVSEVSDAFVTLDSSTETLIDERRSPDTHPEPFGRPGRPLRGSPFHLGFVGALGVLAAYAVVQVALEVRSVIVLVIVSMFLAIGLNPTVERLMARGLGRKTAVAAVVGIVLLVFGGSVAALVPIAVEQGQALVEEAPDTVRDLERSETLRRLDEEYGILDRAGTYLESGDIGQRLFGGIVGVGKIVVNAVISSFTVLVLTLYFLASLPSIKREAYRLAPKSRRQRVALLGDEIIARIGGYVSGQITVAFIAGLVTTLALVLLEVPYSLVLGILAGFASLVPLVGATAAALVYCTVAFVDTPTKGIAALVLAVVYQQVENYVIYPRVMRSTVDVPAAVTLTAALAGGTLLGVIGALLAIPTAAAILLLVRQVLMPRQDQL